MPSQIVVLNGASSAGKTSLGRCLQRQLGAGWFLLGVDDLLRAILPTGDDAGLLSVSGDGVVDTSDAFRRAEAAWYAGVAEIARRAPGVIVDEVLLGGATSRVRLAEALTGLPVFWVGVVCDPGVGLQRERLREDRVIGMHAQQRERVHQGMNYDHVVDTTTLTADKAAQEVLLALRAQRRR